MLDLIGKAFSAWSDAGDVKMTAEIETQYYALKNAREEIDVLTSTYATDKSEKNTQRIKTRLAVLETYLNGVAWGGMKLFDIPVDVIGSIGLFQKSFHAMWARQILFEIALYREWGHLPYEPTSWKRRRAAYVQQRESFAKMAMMFENAVRIKEKDLQRISQYRASLDGVAKGPGMTPDQIKMIEGDLDQQRKDADAIKRHIVHFKNLAAGAARVVENAEKILEAGDKRDQKKS